MKILVTGAAGLLGDLLVHFCFDGGMPSRGTDLRASADPGSSFPVGNLLDFPMIQRLCVGQDAVVHIVNWPNGHAAPPLPLFNENVAMSMNLLTAAVEAGVKQIIDASSVQVFVDDTRRVEDADQPSTLPYLPLDGAMPPGRATCAVAGG